MEGSAYIIVLLSACMLYVANNPNCTTVYATLIDVIIS